MQKIIYILSLYYFTVVNSYYRNNPLIVGNWKSYLRYNEAIELSKNLKNIYDNNKNDLIDKNIVIMPPFLYAYEIGKLLQDTKICIGSQHVSPFCSGPFTGEITASMLKSTNCEYCLVGHYERKQFLYESDEQIHHSAYKLLKNNIIPILCIGDSSVEFENNKSYDKCISDINNLFSYLMSYNVDYNIYKNIIIAYEPIWSIGTGIIPNKNFLDKMYYDIHSYISYKYNFNPTILYGGSVNQNNLMEMSTFDGLLIGMSSINENKFIDICKKFKKFNLIN